MFSETATIGNQTELMFDVMAQSKGWCVGYPFDSALPYDRVVSFDGTKTWHKIQVKTAYSQTSGYSYVFKVVNNRKERYDKTCDYIIALAENNFYMFPVDEVSNVETKFSFRQSEKKDFFIGSMVINHELPR